MADKYTVKKKQGGTYQVIRVADGKVVQRGLDADTALTNCQQLNERGK